MILDCMVMCFVLVLFLHSLLLMIATNCLLVIITIIVTIVEEKMWRGPFSGDGRDEKSDDSISL